MKIHVCIHSYTTSTSTFMFLITYWLGLEMKIIIYYQRVFSHGQYKTRKSIIILLLMLSSQ